MVAAGSELGREITPQAVALLLHFLDRAERLLGHATTTSRRPSASTWPTSGRLNSGGGSVPLRSNSRTLRSEEHTSELQSRLHLVCRLLLEKKKQKRTIYSELYEPM